jgi:hypothetical protein
MVQSFDMSPRRGVGQLRETDKPASRPQLLGLLAAPAV